VSVETFGIEKEFLHELLKQVRTGRIQLPEFQRGWVWPEPNITGLLASISLGYPVGTIMMLRTGGPTHFKERPIEGAEIPPGAKAERLLLDGQQRLTSLFQALLMGRPVITKDDKGKEISGWFYVDIEAALNETQDREEAFRFIPVDRVVRTNFGKDVELDLTTPQQEYKARLFPLEKVFDPDDWANGFQEYHDYDKDVIKLWNTFNRKFVRRFEQYLMPVIELGADTAREAICQVFEKVNTGGVTLTVFELLTATYAADDFDLRKNWRERRAAWEDDSAYRVLWEVSETDFLQAVTLLATYHRRIGYTGEAERAPRIGCRRSDMLRLPLDDYRRWAPEIVRGLQAAAKFLHRRFIFDTKFLPYGSQLIPLSAIYAVLGREAETVEAEHKIAQWFWSGVFGELYGGTTETRFARDLPEVVDWVRGAEEEPRTVQEAQFAPGRLRTLRTRNSAAYKGLYALLMAEGAQDWLSAHSMNAATYFDDAIDIHHIFPQAWCQRAGIAKEDYNSIINKTPLSAHTNRVIGGDAPSRYLPRLAAQAGVPIEKVLDLVDRHWIDSRLLQADDFQAFFSARESALLDHISDAVGKPVAKEGT